MIKIQVGVEAMSIRLTKELLDKIRSDIGKQNDFKQLSDYKFLIDEVTVSGLLVLYNNMLQSLFSLM